MQPNILRARPFRLYRYTGREERNLELLQRLYRVRREMLLNMVPVSRPEPRIWNTYSMSIRGVMYPAQGAVR